MEPSPCTPSHRELSKDTKNNPHSVDPHNYKTKQTTFLHS
jgi:hypothetical protein